MKSNKFSHLEYRVVKIDQETGAEYIISSHQYLSPYIYDYNILKTMDEVFDIQHCIGYDEDGCGVWESYKGSDFKDPKS